MILSNAETFGRKSFIVSSWKLDTSSTFTAFSPTAFSTTSANAVPILPATIVFHPASLNISPVNVVVVVLPFVPVMAAIGASAKPEASSISPMIGIFFPRARSRAYEIRRSAGSSGRCLVRRRVFAPSRAAGSRAGSGRQAGRPV